jgi:release factor glutamine methyltransferase
MAKNFDEYLEMLSAKLSILPDKNEETPVNTLMALWLSAAGIPVSVIKAESCQIPELTDSQRVMLDELIERRLNNVPLAHITGKQSFMGLEFHCGPEALIPRKETELLAATAIRKLQDIDKNNINVIDACTGAGNVAIAIANSIVNSYVYAADISDGAIELARKNAELHELCSRVDFYCGDLLKPLSKLGLQGKIDLLSCNPPYISSSKVPEMPHEICTHEPEAAFDGGPFGVNIIFRLITEAQELLGSQGYLVFEVGLGQGATIEKFLNKTGAYHNIQLIDDEAGNARVLVAQKI